MLPDKYILMITCSFKRIFAIFDKLSVSPDTHRIQHDHSGFHPGFSGCLLDPDRNR
jgi:hypothetical protein